jgi:hypothetical protein
MKTSGGRRENMETPPTPVISYIRSRPWVVLAVVVMSILVVGAAITIPLVLMKYKSSGVPSGDVPDGPTPGGLIPGVAPDVNTAKVAWVVAPVMDGLTRERIQLFGSIAVLAGKRSHTYVWGIDPNNLSVTKNTVLPVMTTNAAATKDMIVYGLPTGGFASVTLGTDGTVGGDATTFFRLPLPSNAFVAANSWDWGDDGGALMTVAGIAGKAVVITGPPNQTGLTLTVDLGFQGAQDVFCLLANADTSTGYVLILGLASSSRVYYVATENPTLPFSAMKLLPTLPGRLWDLSISTDGSYLVIARSGVAELFRMDWVRGEYVSTKFQFAYVRLESAAVFSSGVVAQVVLGFDAREYMFFTVDGITGAVTSSRSCTVKLDSSSNLQNTAGPMAVTWIGDSKQALLILSDTIGHAEIHTLTFP